MTNVFNPIPPRRDQNPIPRHAGLKFGCGSAASRVVLPAAIVAALMLITSFAYHNSWRIDNGALHQLVANISAILLFSSIGFGPLFIYPLSSHWGARKAEKILACLAVPVLWNIKEMIRVSEFFSTGETLYYGLNQVFLLSVFGALAQMGLCELILRWRRNRSAKEKVPVCTPVPIFSIALGLAAFYVIMLWGVGVHFFYWYGQLYRVLFY